MNKAWALAFMTINLISCTTAPGRGPANVCDLDPSFAMKRAGQLLEIFQYLRGPFPTRLHDFAKGPQTCAMENKALLYLSDVIYAQAFLRNQLVQLRARNMAALDPRLVEELKCLKPVADEVRPIFEKVRAEASNLSLGLAELATQFREESKLTPNLRCVLPPPWSGKERIAKSILHTDIEANLGTAFLAIAGQRKYLITAAHNTAIDLRNPEPRLKVSAQDSAPATESFALNPGEVNLSLDASLKPSLSKLPGLKVISSLEQPGTQKFFAVGFPTKEAGNLAAVECQFEGYVRAPKGTDAQYLFYCPGRGGVKAISGGPLVDEQGRVWGFNSQQVPYSGAFLVTPVSVDAKGELKIGVQTTFLSDACYERNMLAPYRCQVMPNMYGEQVP